MKDEDRKILTEFLGEKWHERIWRDEIGKPATLCSCGFDEGVLNLCVHLDAAANRTFDTWEDFGKLRDKIVEKEGWNWFVIFAIKEFQKEHPVLKSEEGGGWYRFEPEFLQWFVDEDRFPELVLEAIKEGVLKNPEAN